MTTNHYDKRDIIRQVGVLRAGPIKLASYKVYDPETFEYSSTQFHFTDGDCVMAVMGESAAKLFCMLVDQTLGNTPRSEQIGNAVKRLKAAATDANSDHKSFALDVLHELKIEV